MLNRYKDVTWNIGIIDDNIKNLLENKNKQLDIKWVKHNYHDRFFADPFLLKKDDNKLVILAEEYIFRERKGKIVKLTIDRKNMKLLKRELLIETNYHLSYPFVYDKSIIPEQNKSQKWIKYDFNGKEDRIIDNIGFIDGTILNDGNNEWLFATKIVNEKIESNKKLYRYLIKNWQIKKETELLIKDSFIASRPGGKFFKLKQDWYRVAQNSKEELYGESISICKILKNKSREYNEKVVATFNSHNCNKYNKGMHTFNVEDDLIIVDGFEFEFHLISKILYKLKKTIRSI